MQMEAASGSKLHALVVFFVTDTFKNRHKVYNETDTTSSPFPTLECVLQEVTDTLQLMLLRY